MYTYLFRSIRDGIYLGKIYEIPVSANCPAKYNKAEDYLRENSNRPIRNDSPEQPTKFPIRNIFGPARNERIPNFYAIRSLNRANPSKYFILFNL